MGLFTILSWVVFGVVVGLISKFLHPGEDPVGFLATTGIGIAGSFVGGGIQFMLSLGSGPLAPAGLIFSILGGVLFCWLYRKYRFDMFLKAQGRYPKSMIVKKEDQ